MAFELSFLISFLLRSRGKLKPAKDIGNTISRRCAISRVRNDIYSSPALLFSSSLHFLLFLYFFFLLFDCVEYSVAAKWGNIISLRLTTEKVSLLRNSSLFFHSFFFYFYFNVVVAFGCVRYLLSLLEWQRNKAQQQQNSRADKPSSTLCVKNYLENLGMFGGFNDAAGPSMCRGLAIACYCSDVVPLGRMKQVDKKKKKKTNNNEENDQSFIFVRNYAKRDMPKCEFALPETHRTICLGVPWLFTLAWSRTKADGWAASPKKNVFRLNVWCVCVVLIDMHRNSLYVRSHVGDKQKTKSVLRKTKVVPGLRVLLDRLSPPATTTIKYFINIIRWL